MKHLVCGAGGFVGGHLVKALLDRDEFVRAVDVKPRREWWQHDDDAENLLLNLREQGCCKAAVEGMDYVWNLATDMGGIGYLSAHQVEPMRSVLINTHLLEEAAQAGVQRFLYTSSACVYGEGVETAEENAWPLTPDEDAEGYAIEKAFGERLCAHYTAERGLETRVARLHNVYGPHGSWNDGREKAPAALCRKVAEAVRDRVGSIEIWGDGTQRRSFLHISDCIEGLGVVMDGEHSEPVNLGSDETVSIAQLARKVETVAGTVLNHKHDKRAPRGVKGRSSDNELIWERYDWRPSVTLKEGLVDTYEWIDEQVNVFREREDWAMPEWGRAGT